jgi:hypothetical protein
MPNWTSNITTITASNEVIEDLKEFAVDVQYPSKAATVADFSFVPFVMRSALRDIDVAEKLLNDIETNGIQVTKDTLLDFGGLPSSIQRAVLVAVDNADKPKDVHSIHSVITSALEDFIEQNQMFVAMPDLAPGDSLTQVDDGLDLHRAHLSYLGTKWFPEVEDIETNDLGDGTSELCIRYDSAHAPAINAIHQISKYLQQFNEDFEIDSFYYGDQLDFKGTYEINFKKDDLKPTTLNLDTATYPLDIPESEFDVFKSTVDKYFSEVGSLSDEQLKSVFDNVQIGQWSSAVEYDTPDRFIDDHTVVFKPTTQHLIDDANSGSLSAMKLLIDYYSEDASSFASKEAGEWRNNYEMSHLITSKINTCESCDCAISIIDEIEELRSDSYSSTEFNAVYDRLIDKSISKGLISINSNTAPNENVREILRMGSVLHKPKTSYDSAGISDILNATMNIIDNDMSNLRSSPSI